MLATANVAVVLPAAIVIFDGILTWLSSVDSATVNPAAGALPESVTVPVVAFPPVMVLGETLMLAAGGWTSSNAVFSVVPARAVNVTTVGSATGIVVTVTLALTWFAGTVMEPGSVAAALSELRST